MDAKRFEQLSIIKDDLLTSPNVNYTTVSGACKLAEEDDYLYDLMLDYMKEVNSHIKSELLNEVFNYTDEKLRVIGINNESF